MALAIRAVQLVIAVSLLLLAVSVSREWRRRRDRSHARLATALWLLAAAVLLRRAGPGGEATSLVCLALLLGSGYFLFLFCHGCLPASLRARRALAAAMAAGWGMAWAAGLPRDLGVRPTPLQAAVLAGLGGVWGVSLLEPAWRFWRAARGRPAVQRGRLRAIAGASAGMVAAVVATVATGPVGGGGTALALRAVGAYVVVPLLFAGFAPPRWVRRLWRAGEEAALRQATEDLIRSGHDRDALAARALQWAARLVGGEAALVCEEGRVVASLGLHPALAGRLARLLASPSRATVVAVEGRAVLVVPLPAQRGGALAVVSGPFTPVFGSDEAGRLEQLAQSVSVLVDRARLLDELRRQRDWQGRLLSALSDLDLGVVVCEGERFLQVNEAYCRLTGYSREELARLSPLDLVVPSQREELADRLRRRGAGEGVADCYEVTMLHRSGRRIEVEVSVKLVEADGAPRLVALLRDITARKQAERQLAAACRREREAAARLRAADELKDAFLTAVSHELRTPLTAVLGFARTLEAGRGIPPAVRRDLVRRIAANAQKLDRLLSELLDLDRLRRGVLEPVRRPTDVGALVRRVVEEASGGCPVRVEAEPVLAEVDPGMVERIVENLVANAVRHTPPATPVWVRVRPERGGVLIGVEDAGPGVDPSLRRAIFEPFRRGPTAPAHAPGVGIGLALVARLAALHGGRAWVEERPGGGASFWVSLPGPPGEAVSELEIESRPRRAETYSP